MRGFPGEHYTDRMAEVVACRFLTRARTCAIELPSVREVAFRVEKEKVWGACRAVGFRDRLRLINQVGEIPPVSLGEIPHRQGAVLGKVHEIIRIDHDCVHALYGNFPRHLAEFLGEMDHEGAVVAGENYQGAFLARQILQGMSISPCVRKLEGRRALPNS